MVILSKKQKTKIIKALVGLIVVIVLFSSNALATSRTTKIYYFDVGQGNASLIRTASGIDILIDGGPDYSILSELGKAMPFYDREIDLVILTHPHYDHMFGLLKVFERYNVKKVIITGVAQNTDAYLDFLNTIKNYEVEIVDGYKKYIISGQSYLEIVYPFFSYEGASFKDLNNTSIVSRFVEGQESFLFPGDIGILSEEELVERGIVIDSDVMLSPHHGSRTSSSLEFLKAVTPELVIISAGKNNDYGHPHAETLNRYLGLGIRVLRTDTSGTVRIETDGINYIVK